jgi:hypothetical protein
MNQLMANTTAAPVQSERIDQIRAELKDGTYETPSKLERALDRMIDDVASI